MGSIRKKPLILSPAGSWESLRAAVQAGADAVYFGVGRLNMRARAAKSFAVQDLPAVADYCRRNNVQSCLALNVILYDEELEEVRRICRAAKEAGISAVIATDIAAVTAARELDLSVHLSTQANISNLAAVKFFAQYADVMVLARELTLEQIQRIIAEIERQEIRGPRGDLVAVELFVHGAMCISVSGLCGMSLATSGHSANRGECLQPCRRSYRVIDEDNGRELVISNRYVMSPSDLCMIGDLDKLIDAGVRIFKIEGRGRSAEYVYHTTRAYREAVDAVIAGTYTADKIAAWTAELATVYNRGFWHGGYYLGRKEGRWSGRYGSAAMEQRVYLGYVVNYFAKPRVGQFAIENGELRLGDKIAVIGPTTGYQERIVRELYVNERPAERAGKGDDVTLPFDVKLRWNDKLYALRPRTDWQSEP
ncbi:MAG: U32 family peptidase [candidate division KSB1 bacterium]|nr:U32 family peptidase [candidate division KSB1 bacterium]